MNVTINMHDGTKEVEAKEVIRLQRSDGEYLFIRHGKYTDWTISELLTGLKAAEGRTIKEVKTNLINILEEKEKQGVELSELIQHQAKTLGAPNQKLYDHYKQNK